MPADDQVNKIQANEPFAEGQWVNGVIGRITPIGIIVKLDEFTDGLLFKEEVFENLRPGDKVKVYIKKIREDGKIDLALNKGGYKNFIDDSSEIILSALEQAGGFLPFTDNSDPELIKRKFHISKKKFKQAIGALYKTRKIEITEAGLKAV